ncbi:hypothetical protein ABBQ38_002852 [Trebouxia sp. C0009 RCD-2024]
MGQQVQQQWAAASRKKDLQACLNMIVPQILSSCHGESRKYWDTSGYDSPLGSHGGRAPAPCRPAAGSGIPTGNRLSRFFEAGEARFIKWCGSGQTTGTCRATPTASGQ